uniref:Uncharacterized protein n=1 Tax=Macaca fascicularis TaxID=9541 RepID=A0A7N9CLK6_MACFA
PLHSSLGDRARPCLKKRKKKRSLVTLWEAESEGSRPRSLFNCKFTYLLSRVQQI